MKYTFSFGKHEGKTFEWVFFKDPNYADWIYRERIHRQQHCMLEDEGDYYAELYRRADHLANPCSVCGDRPLTRIGLTRLRGTGVLSQVGFYCDECDYRGGTPIEYFQPSLFPGADILPKGEALKIASEVKRHFIGDGNLTQTCMEEFFRTDTNFVNARLDFFKTTEQEAQI